MISMMDSGVPVQASADKNEKALTVGQLTDQIKDLLEGRLPPAWVEGEISNLKAAPSGHLYLTLKDERAQIQAVMFRGNASALRFTPENGMKVLVFGTVTVYPPRGQYQMKLTRMKPSGIGELQLAFEQLKARLAAEGLFDAGRKRPLPYLPRRIGIVTSPIGAAIRDLITVLTRRMPSIEVVLAPVKVQGEGSAAEIAEGIVRLNALGGLDLLIVGRGGGSLEDLWAFNEEIVARAIAASKLPVISAVGHEVDFTIADFVADVRAPTPSAAAELAVPEYIALCNNIKSLSMRVERSLLRKLRLARDAFARILTRSLFRRPRELIEMHAQRVDEMSSTIQSAARRMLAMKEAKFEAALNRLEPLSPLRTLKRGYSLVTRHGTREPLTDTKDLKPGDRLDVRLAQGHVVCRVEGEPGPAPPSNPSSSPGKSTKKNPHHDNQTRLPGF
jgi:exodeoxyribonuclease VII large subunit